MSRNDPPVKSSSGEEAASALADVLRDQSERQHRRKAAPTKPARAGTPVQTWGVVAALAGLTAWVWISPPGFVQPAPPPEPSAPALEAGLRMELYFIVRRLLAYRDSTGRLPATLAPVLDDPGETEDLLYEVMDGGMFFLAGVRGESTISYRSDRPLTDLLGDAPARIGGVR